MFVAELAFVDGQLSQDEAMGASAPRSSHAPEIVLIRRPQFVIGADVDAHLVIDEAENLPFDLLVSRDVGRGFRCRAVNIRSSPSEVPSFLREADRLFEEEIKFVVGRIKVHLIVLDTDLVVHRDESADAGGVRLLQRALGVVSPRYPLIEVSGTSNDFAYSFASDMRLSIGRGPDNDVRIDVPEVSAHHARLGFDGTDFWIEDLGSTNGTYVGDAQTSGRTAFAPGAVVMLARHTCIVRRSDRGVVDERYESRQGREESEGNAGALRNWDGQTGGGYYDHDHEEGGHDDHDDDNVSTGVQQGISAPIRSRIQPEARVVTSSLFPALVSFSEVVRPARVVLAVGTEVHVGRDPSSDLWIGAPHISRLHCTLTAHDVTRLSVVDKSTNGTFHEFGALPQGIELEVVEMPKVLNFGGGITVGICFNEEDERLFSASQGSPFSFVKSKEGAVRSEGAEFPNARLLGNRKQSSNRRERNDGYAQSGKMRMLWAALRDAGAPMLVLVVVSICFLVVLVVGLLRGVFL